MTDQPIKVPPKLSDIKKAVAKMKEEPIKVRGIELIDGVLVLMVE